MTDVENNPQSNDSLRTTLLYAPLKIDLDDGALDVAPVLNKLVARTIIEDVFMPPAVMQFFLYVFTAECIKLMGYELFSERFVAGREYPELASIRYAAAGNPGEPSIRHPMKRIDQYGQWKAEEADFLVERTLSEIFENVWYTFANRSNTELKKPLCHPGSAWRIARDAQRPYLDPGDILRDTTYYEALDMRPTEVPGPMLSDIHQAALDEGLAPHAEDIPVSPTTAGHEATLVPVVNIAALCNRIIQRSIDEQCPVTSTKIQNIMFLIASECLKLTGHDIVSERFRARRRGPALLSMCTRYQSLEDAPIRHMVPLLTPNLAGGRWQYSISPLDLRPAHHPLSVVFENVWQATRHMDPASLSRISQCRGSAWHITAYAGEGYIDTGVMRRDTTYYDLLSMAPTVFPMPQRV